MTANLSAAGRLGAEALFREYAGFIANFIAKMGVRSKNDVDDLVQEVFLVAHRKGGYAPGAARASTWLAEIALRVVSNFNRSRRRTGRDVELDENAPLASDVDVFATASARESLRRLVSALDALDLERRAAFILFEIEGHSCDDIALGLGVPVGTVYSRLHSARKTFLEAYRNLESTAQPQPQLAGGAA